MTCSMRRMLRRRTKVLAVMAAGMLGAASGAAAEEAQPPAGEGLGQLSIDELAAINVTSISKRAEPLSQAAGAVYVITSDDLRRSGAESLPEALRLAPSLEVTRIDALDYSITARGFGGFESANKLLVLIDGRSVWTPLFSGVDWDQHQVMLDDVDRIEVVSGPGGTLWGANAVNGVINVTSKSAFDTQGGLLRVVGGSLDSEADARLGLPVGDAGAARVYLMGVRHGGLRAANGAKTHDSWDALQGGFRLDWAGDRNSFTVQGDAHNGSLDNSLGLSGFVRGQNLLGRWSRRTAGAGALEVQAYYDHFSREARLIHDELTTWDVQAQHTLAWGRHQFVWGGGYRLMSDDFRTLSDPQLLSPPHRRTTIGNVFVQDEVALRRDLLLTLGVKLESNSYTKAEWMPNARLAWRANDRQLLWAAVSRAIRNPSRIERDFEIPGLVESGHMGSEKVVAYEAGWRGRLGERANVTVSLFYNDYRDLRTNDLTSPGVLPIFVGNSLKGATYGVESWADVDLASWWRVSLGGSLLRREFRVKPGALDLSNFKSTGEDPDHWLKLRSTMRLGERVDLDMSLRLYGDIEQSAASALVSVPAYTEASVRLAWRVRDDLELSVRGENLLHERHAESIESRREEIPRSVAVGLRWTP